MRLLSQITHFIGDVGKVIRRFNQLIIVVITRAARGLNGRWMWLGMPFTGGVIGGGYAFLAYLSASTVTSGLTTQPEERLIIELDRDRISGLPVKVKLVVGNVLYPRALYREKRYDAILVSAPINEDSLRVNVRQLTLLSRNVLCELSRSLETFEYPDDEILQKMAVSALRALSEEKGIEPSAVPKNEVLNRVSSELGFNCVDQLVGSQYDDLYHLFQFELENQLYAVPKLVPVGDRPFFEENHIKFIVVRGLFNSVPSGSGVTDEDGLKFKLEDQLPVGLVRSINKLVRSDTPDLYSVAIPAIAGTEGRIDSSKFLTYEQSFSAILSSLLRRDWLGSEPIEEVNIVIFDGLPPSEFEMAVNGFESALFRSLLWHRKSGLSWMIGFSFLAGLLLALVFHGVSRGDWMWIGIVIIVQSLAVTVAVLGAVSLLQELLFKSTGPEYAIALLWVISSAATLSAYFFTKAALRFQLPQVHRA